MNYYDVLGLSSQSSISVKLKQEDIKAAYRRALLMYHPDKSKSVLTTSGSSQKYSVDEITLAYQFLSDSSKRAQYDRSLRLLTLKEEDGLDKEKTGLEFVDLDDMNYNEEQNVWTRGCRCGDGRGFQVTENELENEAQYGEVITGCSGCSLWLRISFQDAEGPRAPRKA